MTSRSRPRTSAPSHKHAGGAAGGQRPVAAAMSSSAANAMRRGRWWEAAGPGVVANGAGRAGEREGDGGLRGVGEQVSAQGEAGGPRLAGQVAVQDDAPNCDRDPGPPPDTVGGCSAEAMSGTIARVTTPPAPAAATMAAGTISRGCSVVWPGRCTARTTRTRRGRGSGRADPRHSGRVDHRGPRPTPRRVGSGVLPAAPAGGRPTGRDR